MADAETDIVAQLSALVGGRIAPFERPEDERFLLPAIVYEPVSEVPLELITLDAAPASERVLVVHCWASTYAAAKTLGAQVETALLACDVRPDGKEYLQDPETGDYRFSMSFTWWE